MNALANHSLLSFLWNQVTPFSLTTSDGQKIYAWHILPLKTYAANEASLAAEPSGFCEDFSSSPSFKILRQTPNAKLIISCKCSLVVRSRLSISISDPFSVHGVSTLPMIPLYLHSRVCSDSSDLLSFPPCKRMPAIYPTPFDHLIFIV